MAVEKELIFCGKPHRTQRFAEVCLLILLSQGIGHGYALLEQLKQFDIDADLLNTSILYRTLRKMEAGGAVASNWETGGPGPKRRVYQITEQGSLYLKKWIQVLKMRRACINTIIEAYQSLESPDQSGPGHPEHK